MPKSSDEECKALMEAGFQYRAPVASIGAATAAPPIERLIGPAPVNTTPSAPPAGPATCPPDGGRRQDQPDRSRPRRRGDIGICLG